MAHARWLAASSALTFALLALASCNAPHATLRVRGDGGDLDHDNDEAPLLCDDSTMCTGSEEKLCHPGGFCVECLTQSDCPIGRICDREFECELGRD